MGLWALNLSVPFPSKPNFPLTSFLGLPFLVKILVGLSSFLTKAPILAKGIARVYLGIPQKRWVIPFPKFGPKGFFLQLSLNFPIFFPNSVRQLFGARLPLELFFFFWAQHPLVFPQRPLECRAIPIILPPLYGGAIFGGAPQTTGVYPFSSPFK